MIAAAVLLVGELVAAAESSSPDAVALLVVAALALLGCLAMIVGLARGRFWVRAAILVWQLLQGMVGVYALTGVGAQPLIGWPLIVLAVILIVLLFTPGVQRWTARREDA